MWRAKTVRKLMKRSTFMFKTIKQRPCTNKENESLFESSVTTLDVLSFVTSSPPFPYKRKYVTESNCEKMKEITIPMKYENGNRL